MAHGHEAAVSIDKMLNGEDIADRPLPAVEVMSQKMGIHEWSYDNEIALDKRYKVPLRDKVVALKDIKAEVELGFDVELALKEAGRCLNCDVQTVFSAQLCIECDACVDICPMDCITFTPNGEEAELRTRLTAPAHNLTPGPLRPGRPQDRPRHGEGRRRLPALRPVRRTLPDRRLGHAEILPGYDSRRNFMPTASADQPRKRLRRPLRQRQRLGLGERQRDVRPRGAAHGHAGRAAQHLPVQHSGPADLVRGARHRRRAISARAAAPT